MESNQKTWRRRGDEDMVFEILTRVPAKSLMRFTCVSKAWKGLIRGNDNNLKFVKLHHARSQATHLLFEGIRSSNCNLYLPTVEQQQQLEGLACTRHYFDPKEIVICSNYCNGLVCLYNNKDKQFYLYNISTREIKVLAYPLLRRSWIPSFLCVGYDVATETYKLLRVDSFSPKPRIKILTLGTNWWRKIIGECDEEYNCPVATSRWNSTGIFVNGVLYWIGFNSLVNYFNFTEEKFGTLGIPHSPPPRSFLSITQMNNIQSALMGKLIVHCHYPCGNKQCDLVYDEVNKVFVEFNNDVEKKKVAFLTPGNIIDETTYDDYSYTVLATVSLNSVSSTCLVLPRHFWLVQVSRFVENIIPLTFVIDEA